MKLKSKEFLHSITKKVTTNDIDFRSIFPTLNVCYSKTDYCVTFIQATAVGGRQFRKESRKLQTGIIVKRYYFFFNYCLLSCRYVMLQKRTPSKPKWGAQAVVKGGMAPLAPA